MASTFAPNNATFDGVFAAPTSDVNETAAPGFLKAFLARLRQSKQDRIDAEVGEFIASHGGQLTDDIERQISRRFGAHAGQY